MIRRKSRTTARESRPRIAAILSVAALLAAACAEESAKFDSATSTPDSAIPAVTPEASTSVPDAMPQQAESGAAVDECLTCHGPFAKIQEATRDYVTPEGTAVNPHTYVDMQNTTNPHRSAETVVACDTCHQPSPMPPVSVNAVSKANIEYCYSCHHKRVFTPCSSCHTDGGA